MSDLLAVDTDPTEPLARVELEEALANLCHAARREMPKVGTKRAPTPWDRRHERIDQLLADWEAAPT